MTEFGNPHDIQTLVIKEVKVYKVPSIGNPKSWSQC